MDFPLAKAKFTAPLKDSGAAFYWVKIYLTKTNADICTSAAFSWLTVKRLMAAALEIWWQIHFLYIHTLTNCSTADFFCTFLSVCVNLDLKQLDSRVTSFTICGPRVHGVASPLKLPMGAQLAMRIIMSWLSVVYSHHISKCFRLYSMVICKVGWAGYFVS